MRFVATAAAAILATGALGLPMPGFLKRSNPLGDLAGIYGNGLEFIANDLGDAAKVFVKGGTAGPVEAIQGVVGGNDAGSQAKADAVYGKQKEDGGGDGGQNQPIVIYQPPSDCNDCEEY